MSRSESKTFRWADRVHLRARYQRSVHLERDADAPTALDGYIATPLVRSLVSRVLGGLHPDSATRAWSVTGPYGGGKSAFAVFIAALSDDPTTPRARAARRLLQTQDSELHDQLFGTRGMLKGRRLVPVLGTGERRPLDQILLRALHEGAERFWAGPGSKPAVLGRIAKARKRAEAGDGIPTRDVVALFEEVSSKVASSSMKGAGLLVVLDEAGKALEYAAINPEKGDVQLLQELAEVANRSAAAPILFVLTLHQAFDQYAGRLSAGQRNEWAKVQGRFQDLAFQEASDQVLRLIGSALSREGEPKELTPLLKLLVDGVADATNRGDFPDKKKLAALLADAAPLNPVTALCLGPLFRSRLAQNERSLFAFLAGTETHGLREFLNVDLPPRLPDALYPVDRLYDYAATVFAGRMSGHMGHHWAQVDVALRRLPQSATSLDAKVIKVVGVLSALGESTGLKASSRVLCAALGDGTPAGRAAIEKAIDRLKAASILVYRKYRDAYQLWEGSDLDVEQLIESAVRKIDPRTSLVDRLRRIAPPRPMVARRHLFETGTLRYVEVQYADEGILEQDLNKSSLDADGVVWLVVPSSAAAGRSLSARLLRGADLLAVSDSARPVVVAVPRTVDRLRELALELAAVESVLTHTPELENDAVARREVQLRLAEAERLLRVELQRLTSSDACAWFYRGKEHKVRNARELNGFLSEVCGGVFSAAPTIHNELLNRRNLSSAAAAARRNLLEAMIEHREKHRFGIQGCPPELSMYRSLVELHGLHRRQAGEWILSPPRKRDSGSLLPAWEKISAILDESRGQRLRVSELYDALRRPPFGLKDGVLPVVVMASLLQPSAEVAVYEEGAFVPKLHAAVLERFLRSPERFEVQHFRVSASGLDLFRKLMTMLARSDGAPQNASLLPVVRELVRIVQELSEYARNTQDLSASGRAVREALLRAREPGTLLFRQLPEALGLEAFAPHRRVPEGIVEQFVKGLRDAIAELQAADARLRDRIRDAVAETFGTSRNLGALRRELVALARPLAPVAVDTRLKGFLVRTLDDGLDDHEWLNSLATLLGGKPPAAWRDRDFDEMSLNLGLVHQRFSTLQSLLLERESFENPEGARLLRVSVAEAGEPERERIVCVRETDSRMLATLCDQLRQALAAASAELPRDAVLAGLALVASDAMAELAGEDKLPQKASQ